MGYYRAGFEVIGVDINDQPNYPFKFHKLDALNYDLNGFDLIHASPPCQRFTSIQTTRETFDLLTPIRERLINSGFPYVIENVVGAPMVEPIILCGSMFGLEVKEGVLRRHRLFEASWDIFPPIKCDHTKKPVLGIYGVIPNSTLMNNKYRRPNGDRKAGFEDAKALMGCSWMTRKELVEAIPPAYTEYIGKQFLLK